MIINFKKVTFFVGMSLFLLLSSCALDSDIDGVNNLYDQCPNTPINTPVDDKGCPLTHTEDSKNKSISNNIDQCTQTLLNTSIKANDCLLQTKKQKEPNTILVFSKTAGFRHASIDAGKSMLQKIADRNSWTIEFTEDSSLFNETKLKEFAVVVWLNTTGDILNNTQQNAFKQYIESGGGYVGIHAAADTEHDWAWYGELVGAYFTSHPQIQGANINVEEKSHASTKHLDNIWNHTDEWYNFRENPRANVTVLMSLDETSYDPGGGAMGDHPISWYHTVGAGRAFYTGLGHTQQAYNSNNLYRTHIEGALSWAGHLTPGVPPWTGSPPTKEDFTLVPLASGVNLPVALDISQNGDIYVIGRLGEFYAYETSELVLKSTIATNGVHEAGLIGLVLDPNFITNRFAYFHYTHQSENKNIVSRITVNADNTLDFTSEKQLLSYEVQVRECCHMAGAMKFDNNGDLYIATGDNTNPFASNGYAAIDERASRSDWDAQKSASNTNDLRGKILRITPTTNGRYTIPPGNLFNADETHRSEIYTMGHRNPYRISIDSATNTLYWGEIGPDASGSNPNRGPGGYDEINRTSVAGNFGWPYFSGNNEAYNDYDFELSQSGAKFDPTTPQNDSPNNTGANNLPEALPAWITFSHRATMVADIYRWNPNVIDEFKLPSYFHGRLIYWNFNNDKVFEANTDVENPSLREWLSTSEISGVIDGKVSPANNRLYLIGYGGNCCASPPSKGGLLEVRYTGNNNSSSITNYAINAGGASFTTNNGVNYLADNYASAGNKYKNTNPIEGTEDDALYQSHHWNDGNFSYNFPIKNGDYTVELHFAENYFTTERARIFSVDIESNRVISNLDLIKQVGANTAYQATFNTVVNDGSLDIQLIAGVENPIVSAIKIVEKSEFPVGSTISLSANVNGKYVVLDTDNGLIANADKPGSVGIFKIQEGLNGGIALYSTASKKYISVLNQTTTKLIVSANTVGLSESFNLVKNDDDSYSLLALVNNKYVVAENSGHSPLLANRDKIAAWEKFTIILIDFCKPSDNDNHGIQCRPTASAFLNMPANPAADFSNVPKLLSETGAFNNTATLNPSDSLIPYEIIAPLWSDRAKKSRWVSVPSGTKITFNKDNKWLWPKGTVLVKHFALPTDEQNNNVLQRLETRLIVVQDNQKVYGVTYKWREDNSDAELLTTSLDENITINSAEGNKIQTWSYPSPADCLSCHNEDAKGILGPKTASLNGLYEYPSKITDNQIRTLNHIGLFDIAIDESEITAFPAHANIDDNTKTLEHRVRSYWDMNCGHCHGPQGIASKWDARFTTPLADQGVIKGALANQRDYLEDYNLPNPFVVDPGNINNSILYIRDKSINPEDRMPAIAKNVEDVRYIAVLKQWIESLK